MAPRHRIQVPSVPQRTRSRSRGLRTRRHTHRRAPRQRNRRFRVLRNHRLRRTRRWLSRKRPRTGACPASPPVFAGLAQPIASTAQPANQTRTIRASELKPIGGVAQTLRKDPTVVDGSPKRRQGARRVLRRVSRTAASLDCFFVPGMGHSSTGLSPSAKCLLSRSLFYPSSADGIQSTC